MLSTAKEEDDDEHDEALDEEEPLTCPDSGPATGMRPYGVATAVVSPELVVVATAAFFLSRSLSLLTPSVQKGEVEKEGTVDEEAAEVVVAGAAPTVDAVDDKADNKVEEDDDIEGDDKASPAMTVNASPRDGGLKIPRAP